ncbi:MAG: Spi family protease inhibitor, partial [Bacteroidales bacterium]|nr:Spi family protease inhibitor [Bacteroidales bacterium]
MKKILLLISSVLLITFNGFNKDINLSNAEKVASNFYFLKCGQNDIKANYNELLILDQIVYGDINKPDFYAITFEPGGFVIVSGVDELYPIIGYSIQNEFDKDNQPEHYKSFLQSYS